MKCPYNSQIICEYLESGIGIECSGCKNRVKSLPLAAETPYTPSIITEWSNVKAGYQILFWLTILTLIMIAILYPFALLIQSILFK